MSNDLERIWKQSTHILRYCAICVRTWGKPYFLVLISAIHLLFEHGTSRAGVLPQNRDSRCCECTVLLVCVSDSRVYGTCVFALRIRVTYRPIFMTWLHLLHPVVWSIEMIDNKTVYPTFLIQALLPNKCFLRLHVSTLYGHLQVDTY